MDYVVEVWFFYVYVGKEGFFVCVVEIGDFCFDCCVYGDYWCVFVFCVFVYCFEVWVVFEVVVFYVGDVYCWFCGD